MSDPAGPQRDQERTTGLLGSSPLARYAEDWLSPGADKRYAASRERARFRHYDREQEVVNRWLQFCDPGATVLDFPCGTGRFSELVASCGHRLIRADLSYLMVAHAHQCGSKASVIGDVCCDLARPAIAPYSVDVVLIWRFFHHCQTSQDRALVLERAAYLARRYVIISFYNRASVTYWYRRLSSSLFRRKPKGRGAIWTSELRRIAADSGLKPVEIVHFQPGLSINSAACFAVSSRLS